jgi:uncharacterized protein
MRFICDTNVIISGLMLPSSVPAQALIKAENQGQLLYSDATLAELIQVLDRPKLRPYIKTEYVAELYTRIRINWEQVNIIQHITACRDSKDDKFLEAAINGDATALITGDQDLLIMNPFNNLTIITPSMFLEKTNLT